ncbi:MAG: hemolysin family protein, partial [Phycisphaerae bacterium]|nr:hemolysin family protein [Phycisphaerae bacterium]
MDILPFLLGMIVLMALSAFFSGSETALFSLTAAQAHQFAAAKNRIGHVISRLLADSESLLITLLIGNMVVNVIYFTLAAVVTLKLQTARHLPVWAVSAWAIGALIALVICGEISPKVLAFSSNTRIAKLAAVPLFLMHQAVRPIRRLLQGAIVRPLTRLAHPAGHSGTVSVDELRDLLEVSERRGILHADETMMLHEIVGLGQVKVRDVMVPRVQLIAFDIAQPTSALRDLFRSSGRGKLPVYRGDIDHIVGWVFARRVFLEPHRPIAELLTPVLYTAELATVEQLLHEFRRNRSNIAIVADEYGGTAGLVTLHDVLSEIVGEIQETPLPSERPLVQQVGPTEYSIAGQLPIHDWAEAFGHELDDPRLITVAGLVVKQLGRLPKVGDHIHYRN